MQAINNNCSPTAENRRNWKTHENKVNCKLPVLHRGAPTPQSPPPSSLISANSQNENKNLNDICLEYSFDELSHSTGSFSEACCIGHGAYGNVYRGVVRGGTEVAIKLLHRPREAGFEEEVRVLSKFRHPNLVILMGFARSGSNRALVYELLDGGDVGSRLMNASRVQFPWFERVAVALGAACGLSHLHNAQPKVFHRDVKSPNILLDHNGTAKWGDFGLACLSHLPAHHVSQPAGTIGYADPLYISSAVVTEESEVYSFGWVLIELLTGHPPAVRKENGNVHYLQFGIRESHTNDFSPLLLSGLVDDAAQFPRAVASELIELALHCINDDITRRPAFSSIVSRLRSVRNVGDSIRRGGNPLAQSLPPPCSIPLPACTPAGPHQPGSPQREEAPLSPDVVAVATHPCGVLSYEPVVAPSGQRSGVAYQMDGRCVVAVDSTNNSNCPNYKSSTKDSCLPLPPQSAVTNTTRPFLHQGPQVAAPFPQSPSVNDHMPGGAHDANCRFPVDDVNFNSCTAVTGVPLPSSVRAPTPGPHEEHAAPIPQPRRYGPDPVSLPGQLPGLAADNVDSFWPGGASPTSDCNYDGAVSLWPVAPTQCARAVEDDEYWDRSQVQLYDDTSGCKSSCIHHNHHDKVAASSFLNHAWGQEHQCRGNKPFGGFSTQRPPDAGADILYRATMGGAGCSRHPDETLSDHHNFIVSSPRADNCSPGDGNYVSKSKNTQLCGHGETSRERSPQLYENRSQKKLPAESWCHDENTDFHALEACRQSTTSQHYARHSPTFYVDGSCSDNSTRNESHCYISDEISSRMFGEEYCNSLSSGYDYRISPLDAAASPHHPTLPVHMLPPLDCSPANAAVASSEFIVSPNVRCQALPSRGSLAFSNRSVELPSGACLLDAPLDQSPHIPRSQDINCVGHDRSTRLPPLLGGEVTGRSSHPVSGGNGPLLSELLSNPLPSECRAADSLHCRPPDENRGSPKTLGFNTVQRGNDLLAADTQHRTSAPVHPPRPTSPTANLQNSERYEVRDRASSHCSRFLASTKGNATCADGATSGEFVQMHSDDWGGHEVHPPNQVHGQIACGFVVSDSDAVGMATAVATTGSTTFYSDFHHTADPNSIDGSTALDGHRHGIVDPRQTHNFVAATYVMQPSDVAPQTSGWGCVSGIPCPKLPDLSTRTPSSTTRPADSSQTLGHSPNLSVSRSGRIAAANHEAFPFPDRLPSKHRMPSSSRESGSPPVYNRVPSAAYPALLPEAQSGNHTPGHFNLCDIRPVNRVKKAPCDVNDHRCNQRLEYVPSSELVESQRQGRRD